MAPKNARGGPTPLTTASGGKKQKLDALAAIADCARTDTLAERLCSHARAGNLAGVREVLAAGADADKGVYKGSASQGDLREIAPLMYACRQGDEACVLAILLSRARCMARWYREKNDLNGRKDDLAYGPAGHREGLPMSS